MNPWFLTNNHIFHIFLKKKKDFFLVYDINKEINKKKQISGSEFSAVASQAEGPGFERPVRY